ncbi:MAG: MFS transporter, partial [Mesorhizobium sp.]|nr:MFS transporter [Mesorhizobium sp.]
SFGGVGILQFLTGGVVTAATVPGDPAAAYQALFFFYAATLGAALLVYFAARDAKPVVAPREAG